MKKSSTRKRLTDDIRPFQTLLREAGLRSTTPRVAVLGWFHEHGGQRTHAEVFEALADRGFDRATLYRVLVDLAEVEILSRTDLGDHVWRFELRSSDEHPHFVCTDCGEVSCLPGLSFRIEGLAKAPKAVTRNKVTVQLKGRCDKCA